MSAAVAGPADWPQDVPWYKWPPFPPKPDDVTVIPFSQFVATGLKDDQDEGASGVDQMGVPTTELEKRHDGEKKKRRRKKKGPNGEIVEEPLAWWEEFEEDAKDPRRLYKYNHDEPYMARLEQAWKDFTDNRRFPSHVLTVSQALGEFLGLLKPKPKSDKSNKKAGDDADNDADDADNNADDGGGMSDDEPTPNESAPAEEKDETGDLPESKIEEVQTDDKPDPENEKTEAEIKKERALQAAIERVIQAEIEREKALEAFYQDSERAIKVFLSSHAYDRGIYWSEAKLHDTPILVETFFNFLESNSVLGPKEEDAKLRMARAKKAAQLAKQEMPHANKVARLFPDAWGKACADIWGRSIVGGWVFGRLPGESQDQATALDEKAATVPTPTTAQTSPEITNEAPLDPIHGDSIIFEPTEAELLVDSVEPPSVNGHQTEWTKVGDDDTVGGEQPAWNPDEFKEPPPEDPANIWGNLGPSGREQLETLIGPNKLLETYVALRAESSSRIISSVVEPAPNPPANLEGAPFAEIAQYRLARLTLSPSPYSKTAPEIGACINQPIMHNPPIDESKFGWVGGHDPLTSDITLFVQSDEEFLETLRAGVKMVVTGVFVQVAELTSPKDDENAAKEGQTVSGELPKKKKKKGKNAAADVRSWWFFSQMGEVYPTFFTE